jgi:hypothetical protein
LSLMHNFRFHWRVQCQLRKADEHTTDAISKQIVPYRS